MTAECSFLPFISDLKRLEGLFWQTLQNVKISIACLWSLFSYECNEIGHTIKEKRNVVINSWIITAQTDIVISTMLSIMALISTRATFLVSHQLNFHGFSRYSERFYGRIVYMVVLLPSDGTACPNANRATASSYASSKRHDHTSNLSFYTPSWAYDKKKYIILQ